MNKQTKDFLEIERLKAEIERLKSELEKPDRLQVVLDMLDKVWGKNPWGYYLKINTSESGEVTSWSNQQIFEFDSIDELLEKSKDYLLK